MGGRFFFFWGGRGQGLQSPWSLGFLAPPREKKINTVSGEVWGVGGLFFCFLWGRGARAPRIPRTLDSNGSGLLEVHQLRSSSTTPC